MSLLYSVIVKKQNGEIVSLCSADLAHGNYPSIVQSILENKKLTENISYLYMNRFKFHFLIDGILVFVAFADSEMNNKNAFLFLQNVKSRFRERYSQDYILRCNAFSLQKEFNGTYEDLISIANKNKPVSQKDSMNQQLKSLHKVIQKNIDKVLERENKIQISIYKNDKNRTISDQLKAKVNKMKTKSFCQSNKSKIIILAITIFICFVMYIWLFF